MVEDIEARLRDALSEAEVVVDGDGNRFTIDVVSDHFEGLSRVKRQQVVYAAIDDLIASGAIHAVTIKAGTKAERGRAS